MHTVGLLEQASLHPLQAQGSKRPRRTAATRNNSLRGALRVKSLRLNPTHSLGNVTASAGIYIPTYTQRQT